MIHYLRMVIVVIAISASLCTSRISASTESIILLHTGSEAAVSVQFDGTTLSTDGPQSTAVKFGSFLAWLDDIASPTASFTLEGVSKSGPALVFDTLVIQRFSGGSISLYDSNSTLLLSGSLSAPALAGTVGLPNDMLFTTSFSTVTGGTLARYLDPTSLVVQMHLFDINDGAGLSVGPTAPPVGGELHAFTAIATVNLGAEPIPEPAAGVLLALGAWLIALTARRSRLY